MPLWSHIFINKKGFDSAKKRANTISNYGFESVNFNACSRESKSVGFILILNPFIGNVYKQEKLMKVCLMRRCCIQDCYSCSCLGWQLSNISKLFPLRGGIMHEPVSNMSYENCELHITIIYDFTFGTILRSST